MICRSLRQIIFVQNETTSMLNNFLSDHLKDYFEGDTDDEDLFTLVDQLRGEVFRKIDDRRTIKVRIGTAAYFAKIHQGVGWVEILKNLMQGRLPVLGARNEWLALCALRNAGVRSMTPVLFCERGLNPATRQSAILTESLESKITLEDFETTESDLKRNLIAEVATMARKMHQAGINHRDFYLCHFLLDPPLVEDRDDAPGAPPVLHLIDLHRAQIRQNVPRRWIVKDLGSLLFSAFEKNLTKRDLLRFVRVYSGSPLREVLVTDPEFWDDVIARAIKLWRQDHDSLPNNVTRLLAR
jgi:heptose I phosphotransferase